MEIFIYILYIYNMTLENINKIFQVFLLLIKNNITVNNSNSYGYSDNDKLY